MLGFDLDQHEAAKLALLPDFGFSLLGGRLSDAILSLLKLNPWLASAAISMSIPIYEGGALRADVRIATAQQAEAVAHYGGIMLTPFREVENALANEELLAKRLPFEQLALSDRKAAVQIATEQYHAGRIDQLSVSQCQADEIATAPRWSSCGAVSSATGFDCISRSVAASTRRLR